MKMMMMMNAIMNAMFLMMKHPLSMGMMIIMQTITIALMTGMLYKSFWFSYILFLMYVGGMMVIFIYMTSLMPNTMFMMPSKKMMLTMIMLMLLTMLTKKMNIMNNDTMTMIHNTPMLMKMYTMPANLNVIIMVMYLLFTMITVFNITDSNKSPLRMMYN
uniref:NADH-ubiquinone oxidoreductase chain 6 n=1 Tax=Megacrania alpheus adan TaxID=590997 RepID=E2RV58_9NEOP|nr:NADH dehydrogenase subunit 6 [Megacrania alpheus adan]BAJ24592.1 NADH dehydrogenase subunit 6 [Megacrania alpheus adan]